MSKPRSKGNVKVVEFKDEPGAEMFSERSQERTQLGKKRSRDPQERIVEKNIKTAWTDVLALGATGLSKRDRKKAEQEKLVKLGCKPVKNPKVPLKVLFSRHKKHAARDAKREAEEKEAELITGRPKVNRTVKTKERKRKRMDDIHKWNGGNFHKGILRLDQV